MPALDNRPQLQSLLRKLTGVDLSAYDPPQYPLLQETLDFAIAWVEDQASTAFNSRSTQERRDGNATNAFVTFKRPIRSVERLAVETPILGYTRVYTAEEIKQYQKQGLIKVFTYKLAVEQALLRTVDYQAWGTLFPPLPQSIILDYTYGFALYDPEANQTSHDGGETWEAGDTRDPQETNWLASLKEAAICHAAADFLGQTAGLPAGYVTSVSFDGYSRSTRGDGYSTQVDALVKRRDELLGRHKRRFAMATIG